MDESLAKDLVNTGAEPFRLIVEKFDAMLNTPMQISNREMTIRDVVDAWDMVSWDKNNDISPEFVPPQMWDMLSKMYATREQMHSLIKQISVAEIRRAPEPIVQ